MQLKKLIWIFALILLVIPLSASGAIDTFWTLPTLQAWGDGEKAGIVEVTAFNKTISINPAPARKNCTFYIDKGVCDQCDDGNCDGICQSGESCEIITFSEEGVKEEFITHKFRESVIE